MPVDSPIKTLKDLEDKEVGFVSPDGFTGYWLPLDALLRTGVHIKVVFTDNENRYWTNLDLSSISEVTIHYKNDHATATWK